MWIVDIRLPEGSVAGSERKASTFTEAVLIAAELHSASHGLPIYTLDQPELSKETGRVIIIDREQADD